MLSFNEYVSKKNYETLAYCLYEAGIDVDDLCDVVAELVEEDRLTEEALYTELGLRNMLGGISNIAANVAGLGGLGRAAGNAVAGGANAVGQGIKNKYNQAAQGVSNAASAVGQGIKNKYNQAAQGVSNAASAVGQGVANKYNQAAQGVGNAASAVQGAVGGAMNRVGATFTQAKQAEQLKQAGNAIAALQKQLATYGYPPEFLSRALAPLQKAIQHDMAQNQAGQGYKMGSQVQMQGNGYRMGAAPAPAAAPPQQPGMTA